MSNNVNTQLFERAAAVMDELGPNHYISIYIEKDMDANDLDAMATHIVLGEQEIVDAIKYDIMLEKANEVMGEMGDIER